MTRVPADAVPHEFEVELKFPLERPGPPLAALAALGASFGSPRTQSDLYLAHPGRDFAATDEALRLRCDGERWCLTYKGPKLDSATKTRREIEVPLGGGADEAQRCIALWQALGFQPVAEVRKQRREAYGSWEGRRVHVLLDDVAEVGHYLELEVVVGASEVPAVRDSILRLAAHLGLTASERRSYLELLLIARQAAGR